jgi:choline-glycine betaine transporter
MYVEFREQSPPERTWIKVLICTHTGMKGEFYGSSEWAYFVQMKEPDLAIFADDEKMEYVFPAGEEGYTHWDNKTSCITI